MVRKNTRKTGWSEGKKANFLDKVRRAIARGQGLSEGQANTLFHSGVFSDDELLHALHELTIEELAGISQPPSDLFQNKEPSNRQASLLWLPDVEDELLEYFRIHPETLFAIAPREFEQLIAAIFRNNGFTVELTPETRDGGYDILAVEHSLYSGHNVYLVECKRYRRGNPVGIGIVQRLLGVVTQHPATKGIVVTTSSFTKEARRVAERSKHVLSLRDYNNLLDWLNAVS